MTEQTQDQSNETAGTNENTEVREIDLLRQRCKLMGITFSNASGVDVLRKKIEDKLAGTTEQPDEPEAESETEALNPLAGDTAGEVPTAKMTLRQQLLRDAMKLVRVRITNMDPKKKDLTGELISIGNEYIGMVTRFVPFGESTDEGTHVENVIYEELADRKFLHIRMVKDKRTGTDRPVSSWVREFALDVLPQLTQEELNRLAAAQTAAGSLAE